MKNREKLMTDSKLYNSIYKTVEKIMTHNDLFNKKDASIVSDMTLELLEREIRDDLHAPFQDCDSTLSHYHIPFKFNGQDYDADYWQDKTEAGDIIWCCEVTKFDIDMNMRDYDTEFMWSDYADNIGL